MTKKELLKRIQAKGRTAYKSWTIAKLESELEKIKKNLSVETTTEIVSPGGNWNTAKDWFPTIEVNQDSRDIKVTFYDSEGHQKKATVETEWADVEYSKDRDQVFIRGEVYCRNWINAKTSGSQKFCFAVFVGDSGHVYTHRAMASKGWMAADAGTIRKRLRKLGIGALNGVIQQGDFLLKPANGNAHPDEDFSHERMGFGHHIFEGPVLYHRGQFLLTEEMALIHTATDGIKHPDVVVPPGKWIVGTTANQLAHGNARD